MAKVLCPFCGSTIKKNMDGCRDCGYRDYTTWQQNKVVSAIESTPYETEKQVKGFANIRDSLNGSFDEIITKHGKGKWFLLGCSIFFPAISFIIVIFSFFNKKKK